MSYSSAVDYLYGLRKHGIKLGLENMRRLLALLGNPQDAFRSVHIAGTNGKGSVACMSASILKAYGFRTALFTSPHLVSFTERMRMNGEEISEEEVTALCAELKGLVEAEDGLEPTFFEFVTAMAFAWFARRGAEWAVVETGMGGRLDSTNVITPEVSVITTVSLDHTQFLGDTIEAIAAEKAGIIKAGVPVVTASQDAGAAEVIARTAAAKSSALSVFGRDFRCKVVSSDIDGSRFDYLEEPPGTVSAGAFFTPLAGGYQPMNASLAIRAVGTALRRTGQLKPGAEDAGLTREGIASARLRGRLEVVSMKPPVIVDAAHNASAAAELARSVRAYLAGRKVILVIGVMADKDIKAVFKALLPVADEVIFTAPATERAERPERLREIAEEAGLSDGSICGSVAAALEEAFAGQAAAEAEGVSAVTVVTGSFYTIGEALAAMGEEPVLGGLRELP
jgi:dihydrofolate synthase/folylpolyglutamate synthase